MFTWNCKGKFLSLEPPLVMGIMNVNPDSFYEGSRFESPDAIRAAAVRMAGEGADILDVGGQSTRPDSARIDAAEELQRVLPVVKMLAETMNDAVLISVDTYHSSVALACLEAGASMVNDISAGEMDPGMIPSLGKRNVPYVCMHMKGVPETMQQDARYDDVVTEVLDFLIKKTAQCRLAGIRDVIVDPGFGFGKNARHNFELLRRLSEFKILDQPLMVGLSRKSTIYRTLGITAAEALNGTTVLHTLALLNGADILRVHDVKEARQVIRLMDAFRESASGLPG